MSLGFFCRPPFHLLGNTDPNPITSAYMSQPTLSQLSSAAGFQTHTSSNSAAVAAAHAHAAVAASNAHAAASNLSGVAMTPAAAAAAGKQMEGKSQDRSLFMFLVVGVSIHPLLHPPSPCALSPSPL